MKRNTAFVFLVISIVVFVAGFVPFHLFLPAWISKNGTDRVSPTSPRSVTIFMMIGSTVKGQISIAGANNDIYFYILDSTGNKVFDAGRIYNSYTFHWQAPKKDDFRFVFDNSMSFITTKTVVWSIKAYYYTIILWIIGVILIVVSGILIVLAYQKHQETAS